MHISQLPDIISTKSVYCAAKPKAEKSKMVASKLHNTFLSATEKFEWQHLCFRGSAIQLSRTCNGVRILSDKAGSGIVLTTCVVVQIKHWALERIFILPVCSYRVPTSSIEYLTPLTKVWSSSRLHFLDLYMKMNVFDKHIILNFPISNFGVVAHLSHNKMMDSET